MRADFYYTARENGLAALMKLLEKIMETKKRAVVITANEETASQLDKALWRTDKFLPHSVEQDSYAPRQPIWLTSKEGESPNNAQIAIYYGNASSKPKLERAIFLNFSDDATQCQNAKKAWDVLVNNKATVGGHNQVSGKWQAITEPLIAEPLANHN